MGSWATARSSTNRHPLTSQALPTQFRSPPVLTIHGTQDPTSPYEYAVAFHAQLTRAGVVNELLTVPNGKHGGFSDAETLRIYATIRTFLARTVPPRDSR